MLNQTIMVGRLVEDPKLQEVEGGKKVTNMTLAIPRSYKNLEGAYDTDFVDCTLWNGIAENTCEYCKKGDVIGVKGRVQTDLYEKDGQKRKTMRIVAEKVTFLSSARGERKEKNIEKSEDKSTKKKKETDLEK